MKSAKIYKVGGCVRDMVLGVDSNDIDYVVVNATQEDMLNAGFSQVGKDFPVFLHPETGDEYALARTERKVGLGYTGFTFSTENVTLEDDLKRRDFTINSMALSVDGKIIDPFNGLSDLKDGVIQHTSEAFAEDPVRIFRGARFAGRYDFKVADSTKQLMKQLVAMGEVEAMTKDRVIVELTKLSEVQFFDKAISILQEVGVIAKLFGSINIEELNKIEAVVTEHKSFFRLVFLAKNQDKKWMQAHKFSADVMDFVIVWQKTYSLLCKFKQLSAQDMILLFEQADALRKPERFKQLLSFTQILTDSFVSKQHHQFEKLLSAIKEIDMETLVTQCDKAKIKETVRQARIQAISTVI